MAEFLIYNKTHWMELPSNKNPSMTGYERNHVVIDTNLSYTTAQKIEAKDNLTRKYNRRHQIGDIVEARRDGGPRGKLEEEAFIFLQVPSISLKMARGYTVALGIGFIVLRKRKYFIDMTGMVPDSHQNIGLTESEFNSRLKVKK